MTKAQKALQCLIIALALSAGSAGAQARDIDARLDWAGLHFVSFPLDGGVARVHVRPGDSVSKGARLVELDMEPIEINISRYAAEVAAGEPVLADARRDFEHAQSLYEQTVLSDVELQRARHAYEKASAELSASRARLKYASWQKRRAVATAPFDARVVVREVEPGQMLVAEQRSRPLLILARTGVMTARASLPLSSAMRLATGQMLEVVVDDRVYPATVSSLGTPADGGDDQYYQVEAQFEHAKDEVLRAGQAAIIRLP